MNMEEIFKILVHIDSKLNLLLAMVSEYQAKIPTVFARINQAKANLQDNKIEALFFDLEWITTTILNKRALRRLFELQTLDLNILKEELKKFLTAEKLEDVLARALYKQRHALARVFEGLESYFTILSEKTIHLGFGNLNSSIRGTVAAERSLKSKLLIPSNTTEIEIIKAVSYVTKEIVDLNKILISISQIKGIEGMQRVLLYDWDKLMKIIAAIFKDFSQETKSSIVIHVLKNKEGLTIL